MSLRARLALVLAAVMAGPLVAAAVAVGVIVPRMSAATGSSAAARASGGVALELAQRCQGVGDVAQSLAHRLAAAATPSRALSQAAARQAVSAAARRHPDWWAVVRRPGGQILAGSGIDVASAGAVISAQGSPSCARGSAPQRGPSALVEQVAVDVDGRALATVVVADPIDDAALRALRDGLGSTADVLLLEAPGGQGAVAAAGRRAVVASTLPRAQLSEVLDAVADGAASGNAGGRAFWLRRLPAGSPYAVVVLAAAPAGAVPWGLGLLALLALGVAAVLVRLIAARLTDPLAALTRTAERLGRGELTARSGLRERDEVGLLAAALDAMADQLQARLVELEASRDALGDTFARFGDALGRTHDLSGLLHTVVAAAMHGADAVTGVALLGDDDALSERVRTLDPAAGEGAQAAADRLAVLAGAAVSRRRTVRGEDLPADQTAGLGPAVALPLRRDADRVVGAIAVARAPGAPALDDAAIAAVASLARHAGTAVHNVWAHDETRRLSVTDPLTGAGNFRQLSTTLSREVERASRFARPLSVLMLDLDQFKQVNDALGHAFGDAVLRDFARRLTGCLREVDTVARYGGEEFAVVLPETDSDGGSRVAERILGAVRGEPFRSGTQARAVTVSIGVASYPVHGLSAAEVMRSADAALYAAKRTGRDRWCLAGVAGEAHAVSQAG